VVLIRDRFIEWMQEQDRGEAPYGGEIQNGHPVP
jgi:hypothetical protein